MRLPRHHPVGKTGFTLVELLVVIVLIGIMTAVILPGMKGTLEGELLNSTSRQLLNALRTASNQSITLNLPHRVRFDSSRSKFMVERRADLTESETGFVPARIKGARGEMDSRIRVEIVEPKLELDEGEEPPPELEDEEVDLDYIQFNADGTAERREIQLRDRMGFGVALRINPITSRIKIVELEREL